MSKKVLYCPFCSMIRGFSKNYKGEGNLHTMGNRDYVYIICHGCLKEFWILEEDWDKLGEAEEQ
jgi:hypothetical protein